MGAVDVELFLRGVEGYFGPVLLVGEDFEPEDGVGGMAEVEAVIFSFPWPPWPSRLGLA